MWIYDVYPSGSGVDLWVKDGGTTLTIHEDCPPFFYLSLPDSSLYWEMLDVLEDRYGARECTFNTVYGVRTGYIVYAGRRIAEAIERQTGYAAQLFNVDVRAEQRYFALAGTFPCGYPGEARFDPDFEIPLEMLEIHVANRPPRDTHISAIEVRTCKHEMLRGSEREILEDLFCLVEVQDPDVILFPQADYWMHRIIGVAEDCGLAETFSRNGNVRRLAQKSYWSYGRHEYRAAAVIPGGRILIDTEQSFIYREGGLRGVLIASRLTGLSPNLTARFTPGTLISGYEIYEALRRGIAVPFRKNDPERLRRCDELRTADRGGMMFQPVPGVYGRTHQIDFTSLYPSIIVKYNLSPETLDAPEWRGFLAEVLEPLLLLRIRTKQMKKTDPAYAGIDGILKWMLVTCFGYTGYRNAKFGSIEVHEHITAISREILLRSKALAERMGFDVLHGIVDCLWVQGEPVETLKERIEEETGIPAECETYDWLVFLPQADGSGSYNRYYGRLTDGSIKVRGIAARRRDIPPYIARMQHDLLSELGKVTSASDLCSVEQNVRRLYREYRTNLVCADPAEFVIQRQISRLTYERNCIEGAAVHAFRRRGIGLVPGMKIGYVVRDAGRGIVDPEWDAQRIDTRYYTGLLDKAWDEIAFLFRGPDGEPIEA